MHDHASSDQNLSPIPSHHYTKHRENIYNKLNLILMKKRSHVGHHHLYCHFIILLFPYIDNK